MTTSIIKKDIDYKWIKHSKYLKLLISKWKKKENVSICIIIGYTLRKKLNLEPFLSRI